MDKVCNFVCVDICTYCAGSKGRKLWQFYLQIQQPWQPTVSVSVATDRTYSLSTDRETTKEYF